MKYKPAAPRVPKAPAKFKDGTICFEVSDFNSKKILSPKWLEEAMKYCQANESAKDFLLKNRERIEFSFSCYDRYDIDLELSLAVLASDKILENTNYESAMVAYRAAVKNYPKKLKKYEEDFETWKKEDVKEVAALKAKKIAAAKKLLAEAGEL